MREDWAEAQEQTRKFVNEHVITDVSYLIADLYRAAIEGVDGISDYEEELRNVCETIDYEQMASDYDLVQWGDEWAVMEHWFETLESAKEFLFEEKLVDFLDMEESQEFGGLRTADDVSDFALNYVDLRVVESGGGFAIVDDSKWWDSIEDWYNSVGYKKVDTSEYLIESLEFWIVDELLARRLEEKGEPVEKIYGLNVWGRGCSGQAILLDEVMQEICRECQLPEM